MSAIMHDRSSNVKRNLIGQAKKRRYPPSHYVSLPKRKEDRKMTVCIGMLCDKGNAILMAADARGSYEHPITGSLMTTNEECGKFYDLSHGFHACIAGTFNWCQMMISEIDEQIKPLPENQRNISGIQKAAGEALFRLYWHYADQQLKPLGIGLEEFRHDGRLVPPLRKEAEQVLNALELPVGFVIAGYDKSSPILTVSDDRCRSLQDVATPHFAALGSGSLAATFWLNFRRQNVYFSVQRSFAHLCEAKLFAQHNDAYVGDVGHFLLIRPDREMTVLGGHDLPGKLADEFSLKSTASLDTEERRREFADYFKIPDL